MTVTGIIIGAGARGKAYGAYALSDPEQFQVVGVAEPREYARNLAKKNFNIPDDRCFKDWRDVIHKSKFADCVLICTQDKDHVEPALAFAEKGYNILLEKPMAVSPQDCMDIYKICQEKKIILCVCHVLRYHPCVKRLKHLIDEGAIGEVVNINHVEPVGYWHFAHSFVRGNWRNSSESTFSLLAKCCHDVDLISYWMNFKKCRKISSFGSLKHFKASKKPIGAGSRCMECDVEESCVYSAKKIYLNSKPSKSEFPWKAVCDIEDSDNYLDLLTEAVRTGPYGKCVYSTDNDVCDNQVVNFEFDDGATASLTMIAFTSDVCQRQTTVYGTKGELRWDSSAKNCVRRTDFLTDTTTLHPCVEEEITSWGHGGADYFTIRDFVNAVRNNSKSAIETGPRISVISHLLTFAAEYSRLTNKTVLFDEVTTSSDPTDPHEKMLNKVKQILASI